MWEVYYMQHSTEMEKVSNNSKQHRATCGNGHPKHSAVQYLVNQHIRTFIQSARFPYILTYDTNAPHHISRSNYLGVLSSVLPNPQTRDPADNLRPRPFTCSYVQYPRDEGLLHRRPKHRCRPAFTPRESTPCFRSGTC